MKSVETALQYQRNAGAFTSISILSIQCGISVESNENTRESSSKYTKFHTKYCGNFMPNQSSIYFERKKNAHTHTYTYFLMPASHPVPMNKKLRRYIKNKKSKKNKEIKHIM